MNPRLEKIKHILTCPECSGSLHFKDTEATCCKCRNNYPIRNGKIFFINVPHHIDALDSLKERFRKWFGKLYYTVGINIFAPVFPFNYRKEICKRLDLTKQIVVDAGCGNHRIDEDIICLDIFDYDAADIICDLCALPFKDNSVDAFVTRGVLEHVCEPSAVVRNFHKCTRVRGINIHSVPFLFPFHASPYDYQRYTHKGLEYLFKEFELVGQTNISGPVSLALIITTEFLSILFSLGYRKLKAYIYLFLCLIMFPLKYLDILFINRKSFISLAPTILTVVRKK